MGVVVNDHVSERLGHNSAGTRRGATCVSCTVAGADLGEPALVCGLEGLPGERERCRLPFHGSIIHGLCRGAIITVPVHHAGSYG